MPSDQAGRPIDDDQWERRFAAAPPRLAEMVTLYESLGYDVRLEPVERAELPVSCDNCALALSLSRTIYTRRRP